jgi:phage shock protein PspC (stress-responsive transcriptional regulator)
MNDQPHPPQNPDPPETAETAETAAHDTPRRLLRSREDRVIAGVCGGLGRYFGVDPVLFRIAFAASLLLGGLGGLLYIGAWLFVPEEGSPAQPSTPSRERSGALTALAIVALVVVAGPLLLAPVLVVLGAGLFAGLLILPLALLALVGFVVWWLVSGERPAGSTRDVLIGVALGAGLLALSGVIAIAGAWAAAVGGGAIVAGLVMAAGVMLVIGAFTGGLRWLILPALALAIPVALVAAADIDLDGGIGERDYRPASAAQIRDRYELGMGSLTVDLRDTRLPDGPTDVTLDVGVGEGVVVVPENVCVASRADVGAGTVQVFDRENAGIDVNWEDTPPVARDVPVVVVHGDVGMGVLQVRHTDPDESFHDSDLSPGNTACAPGRATR